tara:strand:+ start:389 stop:622 length:234 start_codon:yes stop_codon:yes gene_type:complete
MAGISVLSFCLFLLISGACGHQATGSDWAIILGGMLAMLVFEFLKILLATRVLQNKIEVVELLKKSQKGMIEMEDIK